MDATIGVEGALNNRDVEAKANDREETQCYGEVCLGGDVSAMSYGQARSDAPATALRPLVDRSLRKEGRGSVLSISTSAGCPGGVSPMHRFLSPS